MNTDPLSELIDSDELRRILGRGGSPADLARVRELAERAGVSEVDFQRLRLLMTKDEQWRRLAREHGLEPDRMVDRWRSPSRSVHPRSRIPSWIGLAAAVLIAIGGSFLLYQSEHQSRPATSTNQRLAHVITAPRGQRVALRLPDGTRVMLAPMSTLRYADTYGIAERRVQLEGEGAFTVLHDDRRPFAVHTASLVGRDLGTEFIVREYPGDSEPVIVVREGRVAIERAGSPAGASADRRIVEAGHRGRVPGGGVPVVELADTESAFAWTVGRLTFERTPLAEVARALARWYDVEIELGSPEAGSRVLTTAFRPGESLTQVLRVLGQTVRVDVRQTGPRRYTLHAR